MERHFVLPISFAAALHGAVLFAFSKDSRPAGALDTPSTPKWHEWPLSPPPEPEVEYEQVEPESRVKEHLAAPVVQSKEPLVVDVGIVPTMPIPPLQPTSAIPTTTIIPGNWGSGLVEGTGFPGGIVSRDLLDNPPRTRLQAAPVYPMEGKLAGMHGEVLVEFIVDETGRVREQRVISSSHRMFEEPTLRAVAKWIFEPGRRDGHPVRFRMAVPVHFNLN